MIESPLNRSCRVASCEPDSHAFATRLAALSHPARIEILKHLSASRSCCCREVVDHLDLAQSTVSQHLKILVEAGLVRFEPDRQRSRYELDRAALAGLSASLSALVNSCCSGR
ncbi:MULTISPECIES: metalloregulator ArsR/SmtB family transcription factor [unclassified Mesorhizobium]|uniref:ArsR/SmtB family transcription factor n=1 Tax=unclassified Mesorhizobium TaxID=325217 RepID=UPI000FDADFF6|nr:MULTISPECIES: metalloregulator ArsR/SmtB family transcription factor [unclassified Mesorhizobium]TGQ46717.1 ArsR family transcriptional regulator [Mesorhizobium sp. M00.F.Ca.ET.216.01.1.1]TIS59855.1 MAG: metalloregulator ArsR/SmtB family transcription factor [Mesorhizobium sp.]TIS93053.1 MAG: metalloregulator ArsR/SmtB family transcription factor [Mesorhizobium sp.]TJW06863.1 MAG: metalloregulator ArsR/SmtB family transcription factor [Mesorhizobium sp.]TJW46949.1 MAG: metalloregulator ArsR